MRVPRKWMRLKEKYQHLDDSDLDRGCIAGSVEIDCLNAILHELRAIRKELEKKPNNPV